MKYIRNWFSNFEKFATPLEAFGMTFRTPEHYYQAMKAAVAIDAVKIAEAETPFKAKRMGRRVIIRPDWEIVKIEVMRVAQRHRFSDKGWRDKLLNIGGDIVEWNNWHDNYWGDCVCEKCKKVNGRNELGKILMGIKSELISKDTK